MTLFRKRSGERPTGLVNLHCHILAGVDDGAESKEEMRAMMAASYEDGIRFLCFTPHFRGGAEENEQKIQSAFAQARQIAEESFPALRLALGNEIFCRLQTAQDLQNGCCRTLNGTAAVLVEFFPDEEYSVMRAALTELLSFGYQPVLAHTERYRCLYNAARAAELHHCGVLFQVNAHTITNGTGAYKKQAAGLLAKDFLNLVADDCHHLYGRAPGLSLAYETVCRRAGQQTADKLFVETPLALLTGEAKKQEEKTPALTR